MRAIAVWLSGPAVTQHAGLLELDRAAYRRQRRRVEHGHAAGQLGDRQVSAVGAVVDLADVMSHWSGISDELGPPRVPDPDLPPVASA